MKLVIFPGGGSPDSSRYAKVYDLLETHAPQFGYSGVDSSVRWPGQRTALGQGGEALSFQGALAIAERAIAAHEGAEEPYDILARSFGTYVALKATMVPGLPNLRRLILWGPPPFWYMWELFVRDIAKSKEDALKKGLRVDETFFAGVEPIESLLRQTARSVVVATGTEDPHCPPAFHSYLRQVAAGAGRNVDFRSPVQGAIHEVTDELGPGVVSTYLATVLA